MGKDLSTMDVVMKAFSVVGYILKWYSEAAEDRIIRKEEVSALGLGICDLLELKTDINLDEIGE